MRLTHVHHTCSSADGHIMSVCSDIYSTYGCYMQNVSLFCPENRAILVTHADYGQFSYTCTQSDVMCCPPHTANDCTESMEESVPQDYAALKLLCDDKTSCQFVNQGGAMIGCPAPNDVDYVRVYFRCMSGITLELLLACDTSFILNVLIKLIK